MARPGTPDPGGGDPVESLRRHGEIDVADAVGDPLARVSAATIHRRLAAVRAEVTRSLGPHLKSPVPQPL